MFIGRSEELRELKERYKSERAEIIAVLGRRRIGKSQLIFTSHQDFEGLVISFECSETTYHDNLESITDLLRKTFDNEFLSFSSLFDVLTFLYKEASKQKIIFVLDEYPYMREGKSTDSEIKNAIDRINLDEKKNPLKFVLCGSAVEVMNVLDDANMPLHGRFSSIITLYPLNYLESSLFYKTVSFDDKIKYYSVFGGIPYFLEQINPNLTFDENIIRLFFAPNGILKSELENQINGEINKVEKASYILNILKYNVVSYTDILQVFRSSFPNGEIDYPLNKLLKMRLIEKVYIKQNNGKEKPYYRISDNPIIFYYTFLIKNFASRVFFSNEEYYEIFIKAKLNQVFVPFSFENIGIQFLAEMNKKNLLPFKLLDAFPYIINDKKSKQNYQFDIVGKIKEGLINFECKYQNDEISSKEVYLEKRQAELASAEFVKTIFISKSKVVDADLVYYLPDLFDERLYK